MVKLTFHSHSCWEVQSDKGRVLIDPFLTGNPAAKIGPEHFDQHQLDAILVTHGHGDHISDVEAIAKSTGATIVSIVEVANYYEGKGLKVHPMNIGGQWKFDFGTVKLTIAQHSSSGPDGTALGNATGIILTMDGKKIYNAGDTGVFLDMQLIREMNGPFDVAILPIGDNFTMGIDEATRAAEFIQAKMTFPQHFNTFPLVEVDANQWLKQVQALDLDARILNIGESYEIS